jgi:hypothetical protein
MANRQTAKPQNGPVRTVKPAASQDAPAVVATVPSILAAMADPLAAESAMKPATLRERVKGVGQASKGPRGPQWQWPESLRDSARSLEPKFALNYGRGNGNLPYGKPNKPDQIKLADGIITPIPEESSRAILSSQIVTDFINGFYNGVKLSLCMANGDSVPLVWFIEIMGFNLDTYRTVESWQSLSKLLTRFAQASGRYCLINQSGEISLSVAPPESDNPVAD